MKWIRVDDEMPETEETVLIYMPEAETEPIWPGYLNDSGSCWLLADGTPAGRVTHWMHFPFPPKE